MQDDPEQEPVSQLLSAANYESPQNECHRTARSTICGNSEGQDTEIADPCNNEVPFPGAVTKWTDSYSVETMKEQGSMSALKRSEAISENGEETNTGEYSNIQIGSTQCKGSWFSENEVSECNANSLGNLNSSSVLINGCTGENLNIVQTDIVLQDIENSVLDTEANTFNINDMPHELLQTILTYMTQYDLCKSVAPVCRLWRDLAYDPIHWEKLEFHDRLVPAGTLMNCFRRATRLKKLNYHNDLTLDEVLHISSNCNLLRHLDLGFCQNLNALIMGQIVGGCPLLEVLNLEGCEDIDHDCIGLICGLVKLYDLNLSHCTRVRDESVSLIAEKITGLKSLNIDGIAYITDWAVMNLVDHRRDRIEVLKLDGAELTDESIEKISTCSNLKQFEISFAELLTGRSLRFIRSMANLRSLQLKKGADLCGGALHHMFAVGKLNNLTSLNLSECTSVDDSVIEALVKCCGVNLRILSLCWCWNVTDEGLSDIVFTCKRMQFLDLLGLDKLLGEVLSEIPEKMPDLTYLNLQQCNRIQDSIIESVVRQKRDLLAVNYYGEEFSVLHGNV